MTWEITAEGHPGARLILVSCERRHGAAGHVVEQRVARRRGEGPVAVVGDHLRQLPNGHAVAPPVHHLAFFSVSCLAHPPSQAIPNRSSPNLGARRYALLLFAF